LCKFVAAITMPLVPSYIKKLASYKPGANIDDIKKEKSL